MNQITKTQSELTKKRNKKGFTLVELIVVIAILAIIALIAIPMITNAINNSNESANISNAKQVASAMKSGYAEYKAGQWTTSDTSVDAALKHNGLTGYEAMTKRLKGGATNYNLVKDTRDVVPDKSCNGTTYPSGDKMDKTTSIIPSAAPAKP